MGINLRSLVHSGYPKSQTTSITIALDNLKRSPTIASCMTDTHPLVTRPVNLMMVIWD